MEIIFAAMVYTAVVATITATVAGASVGLGIGAVIRHPILGFLTGGIGAMLLSWSLVWTV